MAPSYHYRLEVPNGYAQAVRAAIEESATISAQTDGSIASRQGDVTLLSVVSGRLDSLVGLKAWSDAHTLEHLTLINAAGTPFGVRDTDAASLRSSVAAHPEQ
jgi:hypothetical protein